MRAGSYEATVPAVYAVAGRQFDIRTAVKASGQYWASPATAIWLARQRAEGLAGDRSFQAADDLGFVLAVGEAAFHVRDRSGFMLAEAGDRDPPERVVRAANLRPRVQAAPSRRCEQVGPGGQSGNDSHIQRGRRNPEPRHFGLSHSRTQHQPYARPATAVTGQIQRAPTAPTKNHLTQRGIDLCGVPDEPEQRARRSQGVYPSCSNRTNVRAGGR